MSVACTISNENFFWIKNSTGVAVCEQYESCDECPYYDEHHAEVVDDAENN